MTKGVIYSSIPAFSELVQRNLGKKDWEVVGSLSEVLSRVQQGVRALLFYEYCDNLPVNFIDGISGKSVTVLSLTGVKKPDGLAVSQFKTFLDWTSLKNIIGEFASNEQ